MRLLSTSEAAAIKGCSRQAVVDAIKRASIHGERVGGRYVVADDDAFAAFRPTLPCERKGCRLNIGDSERARRAEYARTLAARRARPNERLDKSKDVC